MFKRFLFLLILFIIPIQTSVSGTQLSTPQETKAYHAVFDALFDEENRETARRLITEKRNILLKTRRGFNLMFEKAIVHGFFDIVEEFATSQDFPCKPDRDTISLALAETVYDENTNGMEYLMTPHEGMPLPDQRAVDNAFKHTLGKVDLVRALLTPHEGMPLPSETEIIAEYRVIIVDEDITPDNKRELLALLEPHVPEAERRAQQRGNNPGQGVAHRVHDYADTQVAVKSDKSCGSAKTMRVNDAVIENITNRLKETTMANASEITTRLTDWIDEKYQKTYKKVSFLGRIFPYFSWNPTILMQ